MPGAEMLQSILMQATAKNTRSTVLTDMRWLIGLLLAGMGTAIFGHAPNWLLVAVMISLGIAIALYLCVYIYFAIKNPDLLRSEKYGLTKLAIEKTSVGDDARGFTSDQLIAEAQSVNLIAAQKSLPNAKPE